MKRFAIHIADSPGTLVELLENEAKAVAERPFHAGFEVVGYSVGRRYTALVTWRVTNQ
jgi:hypothetical protein